MGYIMPWWVPTREGNVSRQGVARLRILAMFTVFGNKYGNKPVVSRLSAVLSPTGSGLGV